MLPAKNIKTGPGFFHNLDILSCRSGNGLQFLGITPDLITYWKDSMAKFIIVKVYDGAEYDARERGFSWALQSSSLYIYTPTREIAENMAKDVLPSATLLKAMLKTNTYTYRKTTMNLCFGNGAEACGSLPAKSFTGNILLCYSSPNDTDWLLKRAPNANFCLLPKLASEAEAWKKLHHPKII